MSVITKGIMTFYTIVGLVRTPYETYRSLTRRSSWGETLWIGFGIGLYLAAASIVKQATFRPYLLTKQFVVLSTAVLLTYGGIVLLLWGLGRVLGSKEKLKGFAVAWGYTLIPTVCWFFLTSILYVLLPPPRTTRILGITFSLLYLIVSTTLLLWKIELSYLALRFGLKLGLGRISILVMCAAPVLIFVSIALYMLGIFRVPFF